MVKIMKKKHFLSEYFYLKKMIMKKNTVITQTIRGKSLLKYVKKFTKIKVIKKNREKIVKKNIVNI